MSELNRDFYKDKASKIFGIPYDEVTDGQRAEAKKQLMDYIYGRRREPLNGIESTTSEEPYMLKAMVIQKMIEQGNIAPLKDLYRRFIRGGKLICLISMQHRIVSIVSIV